MGGKPGIEPKSMLPLLPRSMGMSKKLDGITPSPVIVGMSELCMLPFSGACEYDMMSSVLAYLGCRGCCAFRARDGLLGWM